MSREGSDALVWNAESLRITTDAAGIGLWSWNVNPDEIAMNERAHAVGVCRGAVRSPSPTCRSASSRQTSTG